MKRPVAERMEAIDSSGIRRIFDMAASMKNPVNLGIGQPHFDVPDPIKVEMQRLTAAGFNAYTPTQGVPELISALRDQIAAEKGRVPEDLIITSGVSGAILLSYLAIFDPGDEFILPDPYFVIYRHAAKLAEAVPVLLDTYPDFRIRADRLEALITPRTKAIVLNSPANPTGMVLTRTEIDAVIDVARRHDLYILCDEIYEIFNYVGGAFAPVPSPWKAYEKTILLSGFSKSFSMTGWRLGYAAGPAAVLSEMKKLQQYTFVCAPSVAQKAALKGFQPETRKILEAHVADYTRKRDLVYEGLRSDFGDGIQKSEGAFYFFIKAPGGDGEGFVNRALARECLIIPGNVFSSRSTHFRLSFAAPDETLKRGIDILCQVARGEHP
jgi:aspartate aminotransferase/aminotransferase